MALRRRNMVIGATGLAALAAAPVRAQQAWPTRPVRLLVALVRKSRPVASAKPGTGV